MSRVDTLKVYIAAKILHGESHTGFRERSPANPVTALYRHNTPCIGIVIYGTQRTLSLGRISRSGGP